MRVLIPLILVAALKPVFADVPGDINEHVTIRRTTYGVPHIRGETEKAAAFGFAWAQCEDHFPIIYKSIVRGRSEVSRWYGGSDRNVEFNFQIRQLQVRKTVVDNYHYLPVNYRNVIAGFATGVNAYMDAHPTETSPWIGTPKQVDLGRDVSLELVFIPSGEFKMGSTHTEREWATGIEGGATPGTERESYEGEQPRLMRVKDDFWMGRTEVSVGQFKRFVEETGYVSDAEKPGSTSHCFDPEWKITAKAPPHPWKAMGDKSWRDPNFGFPLRDSYPVVCVSWNDGRSFCKWLSKKERERGRLPKNLEYRLPTEAEWAYACRGGRESTYYWWGNDLRDGEGRFNISAVDFLPGRNKIWPLANAPWSDGFAFVSPVDHYGKKGRNGFGLADMCGGVWEIVLDHFDPRGGHEELYLVDTNPRPVCRGGNYFDVPGNARCAVRLGLQGPSYSDSRDGFRICLGVPRGSK